MPTTDMFSLWNAGVIQALLVSVAMVTANTEGGCDPVVDLLFVLDSSPYVSNTDFAAQKNFVRNLLKDHKAPKGAVRVAIMSCGDINVTSTPFSVSYNSLLHKIDESRNPSFFTDTHTDNRHCIENINLKFKTEARAAVSRIAILLRGSWNWDEAHARKQSDIARQEKSVFVVLAVGIRDFASLSAMQSLAYNDATFFVVSGYSDLKNLTRTLSKGSCKPLSLDLTSDGSDQTQTAQPLTVNRKLCIQLSRRMFKRYVPGFGYTRQTCEDTKKLDTSTCKCVDMPSNLNNTS